MWPISTKEHWSLESAQMAPPSLDRSMHHINFKGIFYELWSYGTPLTCFHKVVLEEHPYPKLKAYVRYLVVIQGLF